MGKPVLALLALLLAQAVWSAPHLLVSIVPQLESVRAIAGDGAVVEALIPPGASPESYSPSAREVARFAKAQALLTIGAPAEVGIVPKLARAFPALRVWDCTRGMRFRAMEEHHHAHGHASGHHDPHVWLSTANMLAHADCVAEALAELDPPNAAEYSRRAEDYKAKLKELGRLLHSRLAPFKGERILVFHPAFGYLLDECGLSQLSVEEDGKQGGGRHLAHLAAMVPTLKAKALFTQPQGNRRSAEAAAHVLGVPLLELDPLPAHYTPGMNALVETLCNAFPTENRR
ncbi:MAG: zinc ABC transporter substrate-binding protein [Victivallales bacterium]|nr:zinc ABC transporter substrate-binding protein [Victivallales bacterium]